MAEHMLVTPELVKVIAVWCGGMEVEEIDPFDDKLRFPALNVQTADGVKRASLGDYVVKKADGSFSVMGPTTYLAHIKDE